MEDTIFRKGSTTYYWSSKFFPEKVGKDVLKLYSFVRVADDYIDTIPADTESFFGLRKEWEKACTSNNYNTTATVGDSLNVRVVKNMMSVAKKYHFDLRWVDCFLDTMESDLQPKVFTTLKESLDYVYGSAEVIGLMMAKILELPAEAEAAAMKQGRAMQWINFVRDIAEDNTLTRQYFPKEDFDRYNLEDVSKETAVKQPEDFKNFMQCQIDRYKTWQSGAEAGYKYIPKRLLIPLKTASKMYDWTAHEIERDPFIVFEKKVKPSKFRVLRSIARNTL